MRITINLLGTFLFFVLIALIIWVEPSEYWPEQILYPVKSAMFLFSLLILTISINLEISIEG